MAQTNANDSPINISPKQQYQEQLNIGLLSVFPTTKKYKKEIWKLFGEIGKADENGNIIDDTKIKNYVACLKCKTILTCKQHTGITSFRNHSLKCPSNGNNIINNIEIKSNDKASLLNACVKFSCYDLRPFSAIKGEGFLELAQIFIDLGSKYGSFNISHTIPTPRTISRNITKIANEKKAILKDKILKPIIESHCPSISFTTDLWTETYKGYGYIGLSCHFIDQSCQMLSCILKCIRFEHIMDQIHEEKEITDSENDDNDEKKELINYVHNNNNNNSLNNSNKYLAPPPPLEKFDNNNNDISLPNIDYDYENYNSCNVKVTRKTGENIQTALLHILNSYGLNIKDFQSSFYILFLFF